MLISSLGGSRGVLPVFSFEEEANFYLRHGLQGNWQPRRTQAGELVSLLYSLCSKVALVALDPTSDVESDAMKRLVVLERERFVDFFLHRETSASVSSRYSPGYPSSQ